jgi:hypothetical protein
MTPIKGYATIALDKLQNQGLCRAIVVVPEKSIGSSFNDEPLSKYGFWADWTVLPQWNLCNAPSGDDGKVGAVGKFLASDDKLAMPVQERAAPIPPDRRAQRRGHPPMREEL